MTHGFSILVTLSEFYLSISKTKLPFTLIYQSIFARTVYHIKYFLASRILILFSEDFPGDEFVGVMS